MTDNQIATGDIVLGDQFNAHRMTGYVYHAVGKDINPNLDVPLISHVEGNLWQGGCFGGVKLPDGFRYVVSLYPWEQYRLPEGCERHEFTMYDSLDQATDQVDEIASLVVKCVAEGPTLVHCQAGVNRSGLIAATALVKMGYAPADAVAKLRASRSPLVLINESFENFVLGLAA